jgi:hypothetical protein
MINLQDFIADSASFKKFKADDLLFCGIQIVSGKDQA